jgi:hypothetical protein
MEPVNNRDLTAMTRRTKGWTAILAGTLSLVSVLARVPAQETQEPGPASQESPLEQPAAQTAAPLTAAQLDQLTAPIALYSDPLLGMVLTAATYPLEVVEAARWLDAADHSSLQGASLNAALAPQSWDTSVKALVAVPEVLRMMNENLEWTEQLGDAFLSQQADVMDSIQRLRQRAAAADELQSSPQETVSTDEGDVVIEPAAPDVIYVPCYTPVIYGAWPWPGYPPFYFPPPADYCSAGAVISFGFGLGIIGPYWGWGRWNWHGHGFYVGPGGPNGRPVPWAHDPLHRRGVPYRDIATARRYLGPNASSWRGYRGFPPTLPHAPVPRVEPGVHPNAPRAGRQLSPPMLRMTRPGPPAFESFGSGPRVRSEASRGAFSRSAPGPRGGGFGSRGGGARGRGGRPH